MIWVWIVHHTWSDISSSDPCCQLTGCSVGPCTSCRPRVPLDSMFSLVRGIWSGHPILIWTDQYSMSQYWNTVNTTPDCYVPCQRNYLEVVSGLFYGTAAHSSALLAPPQVSSGLFCSSSTAPLAPVRGSMGNRVLLRHGWGNRMGHTSS